MRYYKLLLKTRELIEMKDGMEIAIMSTIAWRVLRQRSEQRTIYFIKG